MAARPAIPGVSLEILRPEPPQEPLRTDIAGFVGRARRGPAGRPVRVAAWEDFVARFGERDGGAEMPYAIRGYFENGGEIAHVIRVVGSGSREASAVWRVGPMPGSPGDPGRLAAEYRVVANGAGEWAERARVIFRHRAAGTRGRPEVDLRLELAGERPQLLSGLAPDGLVEAVAASSLPIRLETAGTPAPVAAGAGPRAREWPPVVLGGGVATSPEGADYREAFTALAREPEVALVAAPDLHDDVADDNERRSLVAAMLDRAAEEQDRMVIVDVPRDAQGAEAAVRWVAGLRDSADDDETRLRAGAVYGPRLRVRDPAGRSAAPVRDVPASGHVAGVISRLDRTRGAGHTPANARILDAVNLATLPSLERQALLHDGGVNLLRCTPGLGLAVWGGRTLVGSGPATFVAHRRLIHRLIRAIRAVAEPLVFEPDGPELRLAIVRGVTSVLLASYRGGELQGARPEEAFRVRLDETTTPPEAREAGMVICEVQVAPAVPMLFIDIVLTLAVGGSLEVVER